MRQAVWLLLLVLLLVTVVVAVGLVALRAGRELHERRRAVRLRALREVILTALMGEPDEAAAARTQLRSRGDSAWDDVEEQAFAMIPKIKGDSHDALVTLLLSRGASGRAVALARSRSQVRRARGAYRLGALAQADALPVLFDLLRDRAFLVRRTAVRALGQVGDPLAVAPVLEAAGSDPRLTRDVLAAVDRIGVEAAPALRRALRHALDEPVPAAAAVGGGAHDRRGALSAMGLGLLGDVRAVPLLVEGLADRDRAGLAEAAAEALGAIGAPESVDPLVSATRDPALRAAAAGALGAVGDGRVAASLGEVLVGSDHRSSRAVAGALLRLGRPGLDTLAASSSPYAAEALAVHGVRAGAAGS